MILAAQLWGLRLFQGRVAELVEPILQLASDRDSPGAFRAAAALALIDSGREDEARELTLAEDLKKIPWDMFWPATTFVWADACTRLRLLDRCGELYELLARYPDQFAVGGSRLDGSIASALGVLAATLERYEQAEGHFAAAAEIEERLGAPLLLARTRAGWARALIARGLGEDIERAKHLLEQAEDAAGPLGADLITREVAECRTALSAIKA
jgi:tetratricopeptide (TPR) repeat protein